MSQPDEFRKQFQSYWNWIQEDFTEGNFHEYSPLRGNTRRILFIDKDLLRLREITSRRAVSECARFQLRKDFEKVLHDPQFPEKGSANVRADHEIENWVEFKRDMYIEFRKFVDGLILE